MTWATVAVGVGSAALSYYGSTQATNAAKDANKKNSGLSQQQYNNSLMMMEPNRMLGYQAGRTCRTCTAGRRQGTPLGAT